MNTKHEISFKDYLNIMDLEKSKYLLMSKFRLCEKIFNDSKIFPTFQMLISLYDSLYDMLNNREKIFLKEYTDKLNEEDDERKKLTLNQDIEKTFELMEWSVPFIKEILELGRTIYDFVDENIQIESIGINSTFNQEGYIVIPDNKNMMFHIIKYEKTLHKCLKTMEVDQYKWNIIVVPKSYLKNYILSNDMINQIVYYFNTELTFPYTETILPISKRKFINFLESKTIH